MNEKPWASKGVALYPPSFNMVGQNKVFNALKEFQRSFWDGKSRDIAGFFVAFGDWGVGKTRLGYELIGEATGRIDEWVLNKNEHITAYHRSGTKARALEPAMKDGILPLYIRYSSVCDEKLDSTTWVSRLAIYALKQTIERDVRAGGTEELYADLINTLHAKGVSVDKLDCVKDEGVPYDDRLSAAMEVLRPAGINHLWVIVDEVETPGDLKRGLRDDSQSKIDEEHLLMVPEVIKHENLRSRYPYVNFLLLCSLGMRDQVQIGPNLRRASPVTLETNPVTDVRYYVDHIKETLTNPESVEYPSGTLESAFLAANRNFGWLNVIMSSIHENFARHRERNEKVAAWELIRDFARTDARASHIFNDNVVFPLIGNVSGVSSKELERIVYGQLPIAIGGTEPGSISPMMATVLLEHEIPGRGKVFVESLQVHIDARTLADELTKPEVGFKAREGQTDTYYTATCELSVIGLIEALRAFSVTAIGSHQPGDIIIYKDLEQWGEQLSALYPREGIEYAAEALHRIFMKPGYKVEDASFIGMSFRLWKEFNKLLNVSTETVRFFKDVKFEQQLEDYVKEQQGSKSKRSSAVCLGLAKLLDENLESGQKSKYLSEISHDIFTSRFVSPSLEGFRVTPEGKITIVYCEDIEVIVRCLSAYLGVESVHPIVVVFPASVDYTSFEEQVKKQPVLERCILTSRLVAQEEEFLIKYSGRGAVFNSQTARLSKVANGLLKSYQDEWGSKARAWFTKLQQSGYLIAPLWSRPKGVQIYDFAKGYRYMLANNCSLDAAHKDHGGPLSDTEFENCKQAAKKNVEPPAAWSYGDLLGILSTDGSFMSRVPRCFFAILRELKTQVSAKKLATRFFFVVPDEEFKSLQQMNQILELLVVLGVVRDSGGENFRAVNQSQLELIRQSSSNWLKNECKPSVMNFKDLFPTQANILLSAVYPEAVLKLENSEEKIKTIDFGILTSKSIEGLTEDIFTSLVEKILQFENLITSVCPLNIGEQVHPESDYTTSQIGRYEANFNSCSLWEKVSFLSWLKKQFFSKREDSILEIDKTLEECSGFRTVEGYPFPIAPVTLPLKAIKNELENALKGVNTPSMTRRATIKVDDYTLLIDQYLVDSKYEAAWGRLSALQQLVNQDDPKSFYKRFADLINKWKDVISMYRAADKAWQTLIAFLDDAPREIMNSLNELKAEITKYKGIIAGGLEKQIQSRCDEEPVDQLLDSLKVEVITSLEKLAPLLGMIELRHKDIKNELRDIIRSIELQALNRALQAQGKTIMEEPNEESTYEGTKNAYESFNISIMAEGKNIFDSSGGHVTFDLWVEIFNGLQNRTYNEENHPDHVDVIRELKKMKLVRSRLELR